MALSYKGRNVIDNWTCINYIQYVQSRWGLRTPSMLRAGYPVLLTWRGRYDLSRLKTSRWLPHVVFTRSMLIKMYVYAIYSWFLIGTILSIRKNEKHNNVRALTEVLWWVFFESSRSKFVVRFVCFLYCIYDSYEVMSDFRWRWWGSWNED